MENYEKEKRNDLPNNKTLYYQFFLKTIIDPLQLPEYQKLYRMQINHNEKWILTGNSQCGGQKLHLLHRKYHKDLDGSIYDMSSTKSGKVDIGLNIQVPIKMKITFKPRAVVCYVSGHIFIADEGSKCIHLLDKDGKFIQFLLREKPDLEYPRESCFKHHSGSSIISHQDKHPTQALVLLFPNHVFMISECCDRVAYFKIEDTDKL
ncbi:hypothetical protein KUTeg_010554 [Tegillarca granosa]|uniref:Uncharacterized protein n=1 Tax=Tegillarca granosa TaxID=220873 RepID=A0ABQ9F8D4_TEGGR|nr:hypothetical protein KUTeg_010554 [Tegillarca granosa]